MQKQSNRRGLAIGAVFSLIASLFVFTSPAAAAPEDEGASITLRPVGGPATNYNGLLEEDFPLYFQLKEGVSSDNFVSSKLRVKVEVTSGDVDLLVATNTWSPTATSISNTASPTSTQSMFAKWNEDGTTGSVVVGTNTSVVVSGQKNASSNVGYIYLRAYSSSGIVSLSNTLTANVTVWIDNAGGTQNGVIDSGEWYTTETVKLYGTGNLAPSINLNTPANGDTRLTVSTVVPTINYGNVDGEFYLNVSSSNAVFDSVRTSKLSSGRNATYLAANGGIVSLSTTVSALTRSTTLSAYLRYSTASSFTTFSGTVIGPWAATTANTGVDGVTSLNAYVVAGANATLSSSVFHLRANQTYTVRVSAVSESTSVSEQVVLVSMSSATALSAGTKMISINGGALTTSYPSALSLTTDTTGFASFTLTTVGFGADHSITMRAKAGAITKYITMTTKDVDYSIATTFTNYKTGAGAATGIPFVVTDQWGERPAASEQLRVLLTKGDGGGSKFGFATTLSYATLTNGAVEVAFTPEPAAAVGAATLQAALQKYNSTLNSWVATGDTVTANINVSNTSDAFDGSYVDSYSVSVSYWPNTVSYVTVNGSTNNTGSSVVVTGTGLIFRDSSGNTFSDGITVRGGTAGAYSFDVSGMLAGSYTLRMSTGTATTTSLLIVDPPAANSGKSITWDTTSITAGKTAIVTGKVVDMNGNGVDTTYGTGTPVIVVTFAGTAGIPVGSMPTETGADGTFRVSVLTSANDRGSLVLTAAYLKLGANTPAAQQISSVNSITVGPATASASSDQKITVGSFKGFVAIYTLGYTGQKLSAKVAGKWLVKEDLSRFERVVRNTGAGYTIKVDLYIDGAFVRSETVTTK